MKLSVCQILIVAFLTNLVQANPTTAQGVLERVVTVHLDQVDVRTFVNTLEKTAGVNFVYSSKAIRAERKISVHQSAQKLAQVLETVLKPLNISYRLVDGSILLQQTPNEPTPGNADSPKPEATMLAPDDQTITGTVSDENGAGLPGVSVVVKGTQRGTTTDGSGKYSLTVPNRSDAPNRTVLVFSFVGYVSKEVTIGSQTQVNVSLQTLSLIHI